MFVLFDLVNIVSGKLFFEAKLGFVEFCVHWDLCQPPMVDLMLGLNSGRN